jgi:hypothetical protein
MKKRILALCAAVAICSAGCAPASNEPAKVQACDAAHPCGDPAAVGRRIWARQITFMCSQLERLGGGIVICSGNHEHIDAGTGATIIGFAAVDNHQDYINLKLDDGRSGFIRSSEDVDFESDEKHAEELAKELARKAELAEFEAKLERERAERDAQFKKDLAARNERMNRCLSDLDKLRIGMTEQEVKPIIACTLPEVNTTETAAGIRKQVVLHVTETWVVGYLYFEDGRLVAFQRTGR